MSVVVVVPSRGRPAGAALTLEAIRDTAVLIATSVLIAIDRDDPEREAYHDAIRAGGPFGVEATLVELAPEDTGNLVRATNTAALRVAAADPDAIIGNLGDDHRPRSRGWDRAIENALARPGMAYGDDLIHGEGLPSAPFVSAAIVNALGWYFLPDLEHLYCDDAWRELAETAGVRHYLADVVIEHMHPGVQKAAWDEGYERANNRTVMIHDRDAYSRWMVLGRDADAERIRALA